MTDITLFDVLDAIVSSDHVADILADPVKIADYAESMKVLVTVNQGEHLIEVGAKWQDDVANGFGEWSRYRDEAKAALSVVLPQLYVMSCSNGWTDRIFSTSLQGAKAKATKLATHDAGSFFLETPTGEVHARRLWKGLNAWGWYPWERAS